MRSNCIHEIDFKNNLTASFFTDITIIILSDKFMNSIFAKILVA